MQERVALVRSICPHVAEDGIRADLALTQDAITTVAPAVYLQQKTPHSNKEHWSDSLIVAH
eukprot:4742408-Amphidinium_carterae.1